MTMNQKEASLFIEKKLKEYQLALKGGFSIPSHNEILDAMEEELPMLGYAFSYEIEEEGDWNVNGNDKYGELDGEVVKLSLGTINFYSHISSTRSGNPFEGFDISEVEFGELITEEKYFKPTVVSEFKAYGYILQELNNGEYRVSEEGKQDELYVNADFAFKEIVNREVSKRENSK